MGVIRQKVAGRVWRNPHVGFLFSPAVRAHIELALPLRQHMWDVSTQRSTSEIAVPKVFVGLGHIVTFCLI